VQCLIAPIPSNLGKKTSARDYTLLELNVLMTQTHQMDGQNGQFLDMSIFVRRLKVKALFQMCWTI